jgi:hypothetical protein
VERLGWLDPAPMSEVAQRAFTEAAGALGLTHVSLFSGAGHDAQSLAGICPQGLGSFPVMISRTPHDRGASGLDLSIAASDTVGNVW